MQEVYFIAQSEYYSLKLDEIKTQKDFDASMERINEYLKLKAIGLVKSELEIKFSIYNSYNEFTDYGYITNTLYQILLAMNLSVPGSCDLYSTVVRSETINDNAAYKEERLWLTGSLLEGATALNEQLNWVTIHDIPVQKTLLWMHKNGFSETSFARSNVERAIFGMLHSCNETDGFHPTTLISLSQALEALFYTPKMGISSILRERVFLALGTPKENYNKIKKAINSFYDYRSRYVHGETSIPNPMLKRLLDESSDKFYDELLRHIEFAMLLLVASLQQLIMKDGDGFEFSETLSVRIP